MASGEGLLRGHWLTCLPTNKNWVGEACRRVAGQKPAEQVQEAHKCVGRESGREEVEKRIKGTKSSGIHP